jgi:hypothetical protein
MNENSNPIMDWRASMNISRWFTRSFGYGFGAAVGGAIFGEGREKRRAPMRQQTEEEIRADEKRYDEEAKRYEAEDRKAGSAG